MIIYLGLVHYPVYNKNFESVKTAVTNLDIHDIARTALTYGVSKFFIITPDMSQQDYICKVIKFWMEADGKQYNRGRTKALSTIAVSNTIEDSVNMITTQEGKRPILITTTARQTSNQVPYDSIMEIANLKKPVYVLLGTGYGLDDKIHAFADYVFQPVYGTGDYNHLSVRSAAAIILDRMTSAVYKGRN